MNAAKVSCLVMLLHATTAWMFVHAADPIPVSDFFRSPVLSRPVMSPSGQYVAATMLGERDRREHLVLIDLKDLSKWKVLAAFYDADISRVYWVNDERLVFTIVDKQQPLGSQPGSGLYAVDRDGKYRERRLIKPRYHAFSERQMMDRELSVEHRLHSLIRDGSNDVVVAKANFDVRGEFISETLLRLDTESGQSRMLTDEAPPYARYWGLDRQARPRALLTWRNGKSVLYWKSMANAAWRAVKEYDAYADAVPALLAVDAQDTLYFVAPGAEAPEYRSLMRLNLAKDALAGEVIMSTPGYDFSGGLVLGSQGELLGIHYLTDARGTHWFKPALKEIQKKVDALLPTTVNHVDCGDCPDPATVLVTSESDRQPAVFYLYDTKSGSLSLLARSRPWIKPETMARRDMSRFSARDGLSIPVHITRPAGQKAPGPAVVMVHGGPWSRGGEWRWYAASQFLAARGYVVVEPEFRGSWGYGSKLFRAGWKQWGLAMQDDIADATLWAIKQGYANPKQVCIAGASYGGYATLMGLIRYPELYRCGINWVGVTDIELMYTINWSDLSEVTLRYGMPIMVGDREKDAAQLAATSPLKLAGKLSQPLLMAYGGDDRRVPIDHGTRLRDAVAPHNPRLEWVVYNGEGHGFMLEANQVDFWSRVERFLERNLKADP